MKWHTVKEAAPLLGVTEDMTYLLVASGRLAHRRVGLKPGRGRIQISDAGIAAFLEGCEIPAHDKPVAPLGGKPHRPRKFAASARPDGKPMKYDW